MTGEKPLIFKADTIHDMAGRIVRALENRERQMARMYHRRQATLEDFLWLHETGDIPWDLSRRKRCKLAAPRLGTTWVALERMLDRHGDPTAERRAS